MSPKDYPTLTNFLHAWFHQDFDLEGDVPEVVARYREVAAAGEVARLRADITRFLAAAGGDADRLFGATFTPDIDPAGWDMTAAEWLGWVLRLLAAD